VDSARYNVVAQRGAGGLPKWDLVIMVINESVVCTHNLLNPCFFLHMSFRIGLVFVTIGVIFSILI